MIFIIIIDLSLFSEGLGCIYECGPWSQNVFETNPYSPYFSA